MRDGLRRLRDGLRLCRGRRLRHARGSASGGDARVEFRGRAEVGVGCRTLATKRGQGRHDLLLGRQEGAVRLRHRLRVGAVGLDGLGLHRQVGAGHGVVLDEGGRRGGDGGLGHGGGGRSGRAGRDVSVLGGRAGDPGRRRRGGLGGRSSRGSRGGSDLRGRGGDLRGSAPGRRCGGRARLGRGGELRGARRVRLGQPGRALGGRVRLAVVGAADGHRQPGLLAGAGILHGLEGLPERAEGHRHARGHELAEGLVQAGRAGLALAVQADGQVRPALQDATDEAGEHRPGAHLDEGPDARGVHRLDGLDEADRLRDLVGQERPHRLGVRGVRRRLAVAIDRHRGRAQLDVLQEGAEGHGGVGDHAAVERGGHGQPREADPHLLQLGLRLVHAGRRAADDHLGRVVVVREDHALDGPLGQLGAQGVGVGGDRAHRARLGGRFGHPLAALAGHADRVGRAQRAGGLEGHDLAEAVAGGRGGLHAQRGHQRGVGLAGRTERWLGPLGGGELGRLGLLGAFGEAGLGEDHVGQLGQDRSRVLPGLGGLGPGHRDLRAHVHVLAALAREDEGQVALGRSGTEGHAVGRRERLALRDLGGSLDELLGQLGAIRGHHAQAARGGGVVVLLRGAREEGEHAVGGGVRGHRLGGLGQRGRGVGGEHHQLGGQHAPTEPAVALPAVLFERDVEVGAAEAERAHARAARVRFRADPGARAGAQVEGRALQLHLRIGRVDLDGRREHLVVQREHGLHQTGGAGGGLAVAHLGLHRSQRAPLAVLATALVEDHAQTAELGGVTGDGAGAVRLDELHAPGAVAGVLVGAPDGLGLALALGRVDGGPAAVAAGADAADHGVDAVTVLLGLVQALEGDHAEAFAEHGAVGLVAEGPAVAALGERRRLREAEVHEDVVHRVRASADHDVRLAEVELVHRHRERAERGCTGRVGDAVGTAEVQAVGDAPGDDVAEHAGEGGLLPGRVVALDALAGLLDLVLAEAHLAQGLGPHRALQPADHRAEELLGAGHAEDDAHPLAVGVVELTLGRVLEDPLGHDERQELAGVRRRDRRGRHAPSHRVEVDLGDEGAALRVGLVRRLGIGVVVVLDQPVGGRHVAHAIGALEDVAPEAGRVDRAGEEGAEADDGDGGMLGGRHDSIRLGGRFGRQFRRGNRGAR